MAGEGGARKINLFYASVTNVVNAYMECAKYLGFETGRYMGAGLDMDALLQRVHLKKNPSTREITNIIEKATSGTPLFQQPLVHGDRETVQRKRVATVELCSHKPRYVMQSVQCQYHGKRHIDSGQTQYNKEACAKQADGGAEEEDIICVTPEQKRII